ncbi:hypothetical protein, partial [Bilophila wadsworthia]|uniref:hypothetical protein n=1 Tax=Bilophila wadsworthia TaxID=35833 RepID=UPI003AB66BA9
MPTSVINEILSFCPQGTIASGDIMALEDYKNDVQRLRGHQPGIARRELENMALRQSSFVAAGLAQFVAKRYAPGVRDDADLDALETAITAAITALIAAGNAQTATRLATKRTIGGVAFDGSANIHHYATCSTAAATAAKTVALSGFALATGARVLVKFTVTNSAANPTLDVNGTGAKPIQYRGAAIAAGTLAANRTYEFVYTGAQYELVGDVDTNTTYSLATASNDGLMAKGDKGKLDGIAVGAEVNQNAFGNILVGSTTIAADTKTDTLTFVAGTNVTLTPDAANDKLTIAAKDTTYAAATQSVAGLMSAADKKKLDGVAPGAEVNQNAFSNILVGSTTIAADTKTDTLTFVAGTNVTLTPDAANDKLTIAAKDTTYAAATQSVAGLMSAADKKSVDYCEALRLSMIGVPRYWRSTTLPANHVWANGDLVLFSDWPELKKVYDGGGFTGMLLAYNATSATIAANLGKWRPNAANPTGLYVPKLSDQFFRGWRPGAGREAGSWQGDAIRNLVGIIDDVHMGQIPSCQGVFSWM